MNVLFLSELLYPHGGGAELATFLYAKLLSERGFNIVVITNKFNSESGVSRFGRLTIYRLPLLTRASSVKYSIMSRVDILLSGFLRKLIRWADIVYVPRFWYSAILLAKAYRKPVITHLHDYIPLCPLSNLYDATEECTCSKTHVPCSPKCIYSWEKAQGRGLLDTLRSTALNLTLGVLLGKCVKLSDAIVCVSKTHRNTILQRDNSFQTKLHTIYNPLPDVHYDVCQDNDFGYFGGLSRLKGFHVLYQALGCINRNKRIVTVRALGFSESSNYCSDWFSNVGFTTYGRLGKKEYEEVYRNIQYVIVPSVCQETFSYVVVEALLSERIVIASEIGAIPEVTAGCDGVFLFPSGDSQQLASKILYVRQLDKTAMTELGKKNREKTLSKFDNEKSISEFIHLMDLVSN